MKYSENFRNDLSKVTEEEWYIALATWNYEQGENVLECFLGSHSSDGAVVDMMEWAFERGYITQEKLDNFRENGGRYDYEAILGYDEPYAIMYETSEDDQPYFKALHLIAEYATTDRCDIKNKLYKFLFEGYGWSTIEGDTEAIENNKNYLFDCMDKWVEGDSPEDYCMISKRSVSEFQEMEE